MMATGVSPEVPAVSRPRRRMGGGGSAHRRAPARRHDCLLDFGRAADGASHKAALCLLVVSDGVLKPALKTVLALASERVTDHGESAPRAGRSARPSARPARSAGHGSATARGCAPRDFRRIDLGEDHARLGAASAMILPTDRPPASGRRSRGRARAAALAAANTKQPFSMARARISTCQWLAGLFGEGRRNCQERGAGLSQRAIERGKRRS